MNDNKVSGNKTPFFVSNCIRLIPFWVVSVSEEVLVCPDCLVREGVWADLEKKKLYLGPEGEICLKSRGTWNQPVLGFQSFSNSVKQVGQMSQSFGKQKFENSEKGQNKIILWLGSALGQLRLLLKWKLNQKFQTYPNIYSNAALRCHSGFYSIKPVIYHCHI